MAPESLAARRYSIRGRVQGVGFRDFAQRSASQLDLRGYARNLPDGSVLVLAVGSVKSLDTMESILRKGPAWADVTALTVEEAPAQDFSGFRIVP